MWMVALRSSPSKEVDMRLIKCKRCGAEILASGEQAYCAECRSIVKSESVIRDRVCVDCGITYPGMPSSKLCPSCSTERARERERAYKKNGAVRKIGSTDICVICGEEYTVTSGLQKYCPDCAKEAYRAKSAKRKHDGWVNNPTEQQERRRTLKKDRKVCVVCGKLFDIPIRVTCSEECAKIHKSNQQKKFDALRPNRQKKENKS